MAKKSAGSGGNPPDTLTETERVYNEAAKMLIDHTYCGELLLQDKTTKASYLAFHNSTPQCTAELGNKKDPLESIHEAVKAQATLLVKDPKTGAVNADKLNDVMTGIYQKLDEALNLVPKRDYNGFGESTLAWIRRHTNRSEPKLLEHHLDCTPQQITAMTRTSLTNIAQCVVKDDDGPQAPKTPVAAKSPASTVSQPKR